MRLYATRLQEGVDLKQAIVEFASSKQLTNAVVLGAIGIIKL